MQKKQLFWILLALIICIPLARYIDTIPEREKIRKELLESDRLQRQKEVDDSVKNQKMMEMQRQSQIEQNRNQVRDSLIRKKSEILRPIKSIMQDLVGFITPGEFQEVIISGDTYNEIKFWTKEVVDGGYITHEFYLKDVTFRFGHIYPNESDQYFFVSCNNDELCIIESGSERVNSFSFYPQESPKLRQLLISLLKESKEVEGKILSLNQQIESI